ncbi:hypothetical protein COCNU_contig69484884G000010 [Cocos nucifera]|nr:hypothetical protein [Cocos nucifera]
MLRAVVRRLVLASSRPSILSRAVSAGPVLFRRPDLSVHRFPVFRPFPLVLDLSRGYAAGRRKRIPYDEDSDLDDSDDEEIREGDNFDSYEVETWVDDTDGAEDMDFEEEDFSGESMEESD